MSLGTPEIIIIFVLVLILFGPSRLPDLARTVGRGMRELRKASAEIQSHFNLDDDEARNPSWREARREASYDARDLPPRDEPPIETTYEPYDVSSHDTSSHDVSSHDVLPQDASAWHAPASEAPSETQPSPVVAPTTAPPATGDESPPRL